MKLMQSSNVETKGVLKNQQTSAFAPPPAAASNHLSKVSSQNQNNTRNSQQTQNVVQQASASASVSQKVALNRAVRNTNSRIQAKLQQEAELPANATTNNLQQEQKQVVQHHGHHQQKKGVTFNSQHQTTSTTHQYYQLDSLKLNKYEQNQQTNPTSHHPLLALPTNGPESRTFQETGTMAQQRAQSIKMQHGSGLGSGLGFEMANAFGAGADQILPPRVGQSLIEKKSTLSKLSSHYQTADMQGISRFISMGSPTQQASEGRATAGTQQRANQGDNNQNVTTTPDNPHQIQLQQSTMYESQQQMTMNSGKQPQQNSNHVNNNRSTLESRAGFSRKTSTKLTSPDQYALQGDFLKIGAHVITPPSSNRPGEFDFFNANSSVFSNQQQNNQHNQQIQMQHSNNQPTNNTNNNNSSSSHLINTTMQQQTSQSLAVKRRQPNLMQNSSNQGERGGNGLSPLQTNQIKFSNKLPVNRRLELDQCLRLNKSHQNMPGAANSSSSQSVVTASVNTGNGGTVSRFHQGGFHQQLPGEQKDVKMVDQSLEQHLHRQTMGSMANHQFTEMTRNNGNELLIARHQSSFLNDNNNVAGVGRIGSSPNVDRSLIQRHQNNESQIVRNSTLSDPNAFQYSLKDNSDPDLTQIITSDKQAADILRHNLSQLQSGISLQMINQATHRTDDLSEGSVGQILHREGTSNSINSSFRVENRRARPKLAKNLVDRGNAFFSKQASILSSSQKRHRGGISSQGNNQFSQLTGTKPSLRGGMMNGDDDFSNHFAKERDLENTNTNGKDHSSSSQIPPPANSNNMPDNKNQFNFTFFNEGGSSSAQKEPQSAMLKTNNISQKVKQRQTPDSFVNLSSLITSAHTKSRGISDHKISSNLLSQVTSNYQRLPITSTTAASQQQVYRSHQVTKDSENSPKNATKPNKNDAPLQTASDQQNQSETHQTATAAIQRHLNLQEKQASKGGLSAVSPTINDSQSDLPQHQSKSDLNTQDYQNYLHQQNFESTCSAAIQRSEGISNRDPHNFSDNQSDVFTPINGHRQHNGGSLYPQISLSKPSQSKLRSASTGLKPATAVRLRQLPWHAINVNSEVATTATSHSRRTAENMHMGTGTGSGTGHGKGNYNHVLLGGGIGSATGQRLQTSSNTSSSQHATNHSHLVQHSTQLKENNQNNNERRGGAMLTISKEEDAFRNLTISHNSYYQRASLAANQQQNNPHTNAALDKSISSSVSTAAQIQNRSRLSRSIFSPSTQQQSAQNSTGYHLNSNSIPTRGERSGADDHNQLNSTNARSSFGDTYSHLTQNHQIGGADQPSQSRFHHNAPVNVNMVLNSQTSSQANSHNGYVVYQPGIRHTTHQTSLISTSIPNGNGGHASATLTNSNNNPPPSSLNHLNHATSSTNQQVSLLQKFNTKLASHPNNHPNNTISNHHTGGGIGDSMMRQSQQSGSQVQQSSGQQNGVSGGVQGGSFSQKNSGEVMHRRKANGRSITFDFAAMNNSTDDMIKKNQLQLPRKMIIKLKDRKQNSSKLSNHHMRTSSQKA